MTCKCVDVEEMRFLKVTGMVLLRQKRDETLIQEATFCNKIHTKLTNLFENGFELEINY